MKLVQSTIVAGMLVVAVSGCSNGNDASTDAKSAASSSASKATSAAQNATNSAPSSATTSGESSPSSSSEAGAAQAPAGTQLVTAPVAKISFAVPKEWVVVTDATAKDPAVLKKLEPMAKHQSVAPEKLTQVYTSVGDVVALDPDAAHVTNASNLNVLKMTTPVLLTKEQFIKDFQTAPGSKFKPTLGDYSKISTPSGQGAQMEYSVAAQGKTLHGVSMEIPNGTGNYARVTVSAASASDAEKVARQVTSSAHRL